MRVLAVGAHPDDVELGCGATLLRHVARGDEVTILVMTAGQRGLVEGMSRLTEQEDAAERLGVRLCWGGFEDGLIPDGPDAINVIDDIIATCGAETLYSHAPNDPHQDHRATATASLAAGRRLPTVLRFETPSTLAFEPTIYVDVAETLDRKMAALRSHLSQVLRQGPVDLEAIEAQARFRGSQGRIRYAEAFEAARLAWDLATPDASPETVAPVRALSSVSTA
ncbi:MAG TPA: PIG-L deacetylase family protein [Acidimicrobiia bacterium]|nr:PIG-L deacetylase family protein [Acidimicrobiia bacterium]